jgi:predicted Zn-dependent protease
MLQLLVYNAIVQKEDEKMAAVKVKPIQPTVVSDTVIIKDIIHEATTNPSSAALKRNREASLLLRRLQRKQIKQ